jgi:hypothetical protein
MANNYKNIVITPNIGSATDDPRIRFSGGNNTINTDITLRVYPTSNGTLSFEGSAGQLFSITNDLSGVIFSVNDISGIPSLEIDANGRISLAQFSGNVGIGTTTPSYKLDVSGDMRVTGNVTLGDASTDTIIINGSIISLGNNQSIDSGTLFIDAVNNEVGIGTTNPTSNLHVIGSANITTVLVVGTTNVVPTIQSVFANANTTHTLTVASFNAANASFANGNTNFGTTIAAFSAANASFANGNTNFTVLQTVSGVANSGWLQANAAYNNANTRLTGNTGSVGNSLLRANGTGGLTVQNSAVIVDNSGNMTGIAGLTASGTATVGNLTLSNPGVGVTSTINFAKTNDTAAIKVTEWASDLTEFQFHMSDNPESGDKFNWLIQGWQGRGNDWKPLEFTAYTTTISATKNIIDGPSFFGNQPFYAANGVKNIVFSQKTGTLNITPNVSNYVGSGLQTIYIVLDSPTTFSAYNQELYGPTQYIVSNTITGGAQTITAGITVTFSGTTGGVTGDKYWFGVWPAGRITSASGYEVSNVSVIDSGRNATFINVAATQTNTTTLLIGSLNVAPTLQAAFGAANAAFANANTTHTLTIASFAAANAAFANGNTNFTTLQLVSNVANSGFLHANAAFLAANTKFNSSGGTISGSVSINGDLFISGNTISTNASTLVIGDPLIYLAGNNYTTDAVDIGFVGNYVNATGSNVHTGLYREYVSKEYYLFYGYDKEPDNNHIDPNGNNFTIAVLNAAIRTSNLNLGGVNAISWLNATYTAANASFANGNTNFGTTVAAFGAANASFANGNTNFSTLQVAFGAANASFANGNTNFTVLQTVFGVANAAFANANSTHTLTIASFNAANASFANGNTNFGTTVAAFNAANASFANGNTNFSTLQVAFGAANAAFANANSTHTLTIASFAAANASFANGNTNFGTTVAAFGAANSAFANGNTNFTVLQTVFGVANSAFSNANSTHTLTISAFNAANAAFANANSTHTLTIESFNAANASFANGNTNFGTTIASFATANAAFANANSTHTLTIESFNAANAAFANGNTNFSTLQVVFGTANASFANGNTNFGTTIASFAAANAAFANANSTHTLTIASFNAANASFANGNTNFGTTVAAFNKANSAFDDTAGRIRGVNAQTGTTYIFALGDAGDLVTGNNASAQTFTVPPNANVAFPVGTTVINLAQLGAGQLGIAAGTGVTIRSSGSKLKLTGQYSAASIVKIGTNEWIFFGDITA